VVGATSSEDFAVNEKLVIVIPKKCAEMNWISEDEIKSIVSEILKPSLHDKTGCTTGLETGLMFVYTIQPVVKPVVKRVWQTRFDNRLYRVNGA